VLTVMGGLGSSAGIETTTVKSATSAGSIIATVIKSY